MFRNFIAAMVFSLVAATSFAAQTQIDTSGLSEAQIAELNAKAALAVAEAAANANAPAVKDPGALVTLAATWGPQMAAAAEGFAKALGIAARELNITVNDFLKSDAGKLTAILIIWKVAGTAAVKMLYTVFFVIVAQIVARVVYVRLFTKDYEKVEYSRFGGFFKGTKMVRVPKGFHDLSNDGEWLAFWVMIILSIGSLVVGAIIVV